MFIANTKALSPIPFLDFIKYRKNRCPDGYSLWEGVVDSVRLSIGAIQLELLGIGVRIGGDVRFQTLGLQKDKTRIYSDLWTLEVRDRKTGQGGT